MKSRMDELARLADINPSLNEFYQDVRAITSPGHGCPEEELDWNWIINEAYRRLRESNG